MILKIALVALALLVSAHAFAQPTFLEGEGDDADRLHAEALQLGAAGRHREAWEMLRQAYALKASYDIAANLGEAELRLGMHRDAAEHLAASLREAPTGRKSLRKKIEASLAKAKKEIATVRVHAAGASRVRVNDRLIDPGYEVFLDAGSHRFSAEGEGYQPASLQRQLIKGQATTVELVLLPEEGDVEAGGEHPMPALLGVGYGLGGAALIAAGVLGGLSASKAGAARRRVDSLPDEAPCRAGGALCEEILELREEQKQLSNAAIWMLIAGGALALGTTVYLLVSLPSGEASGKLVPLVGPGLAGGSLQLSF